MIQSDRSESLMIQPSIHGSKEKSSRPGVESGQSSGPDAEAGQLSGYGTQIEEYPSLEVGQGN